MIKVLIADDEPEFRDYLAHLTDWNALGFEICGQARNGKEALELASLHALGCTQVRQPLVSEKKY